MFNPAPNIRLVTASGSDMDQREVVTHAARGYWLFEVVRRGAFEVRVPDGPWCELTEGRGVIYRPHTPHDERVPRGVCTSAWAFLEIDDDALFDDMADAPSMWVFDDPQQIAAGCLESLRKTTGPDGPAQLIRHGLLCELVGRLLAAARRDGPFTVTDLEEGNDSVIERADRYMRRHLHTRCRVADVAEHVGLSESGLHHAYRRVTGQTPMAALRTMRLEAARALLLRGVSTLETIAAQTGFADAFHLSKSFKRHFGVSPRAYLRSTV